MTDTEMQIAIAEWYGEKSICVRCECEFHISLQTCPQCGCTYTGNRTTKDYLNDLNAMHEAVTNLPDQSPFLSSPSPKVRYVGHLSRLLGVQLYDNGTFVGCPDDLFILTNATARQRAEALLRTVNLWKE